MISRLLGQETEYAIRFSPAPGGQHPGNFKLFSAFKHAIKKIVRIRPGERSYIQEQFFVENGGAFCYEHLPYAPDGGLLEGATPETRSPTELLVYQRAQELLLKKALPGAKAYLKRIGFEGDLGLLKNCRDSQGHIYGAQENYETEIAGGLSLWLYRLSIVLIFPPLLVVLLFYWLTVISALLFWLVFILLGGNALTYCTEITLKILAYTFGSHTFLNYGQRFGKWSDLLGRRIGRYTESDEFATLLGKIEFSIFYRLLLLIFTPYSLALRLFSFRKQRRVLESFLISRPIISGAGTLNQDRTFSLSEKGTAIRRLMRLTPGPDDRPLFDNGNLQKALMLGAQDFLLMRFSSLPALFGVRQRLQIGMSDSNRAQVAEYLKIGTTLLVLEMAEAGFLKRGPRFRKPIKALRELNSDPGLEARAKLRSADAKSFQLAPEASALEIQEFYADRAREFLQKNKTAPLEYFEILKLWEETLTLLKENPGALVGRLDWVSKRYLLESAGENVGEQGRKKIDLAYHELGAGYFDLLEKEGIAPRLVAEEDIETAVQTPSSPERVQARSRFIRDLRYPGRQITISWNQVRIGARWNERVVSLKDYRERTRETD